MSTPYEEGVVIDYDHPSWGRCTGTVLVPPRRLAKAGMGPERCEQVLVQDHHPHGAREWVDLTWIVGEGGR